MDWLQAQSKARAGKMVRRGKWPETKVVSDNAGTLSVTDERGFGEPFYPTAEDREASDWRECTAEELAEAQAAARKEAEEKDKAAQDQAAKNAAPPEAEVEGGEHSGHRKGKHR